jgi:hypothetical protein
MMTDTDSDIETTREAIADDEMLASYHLSSEEKINARWYLCDSQQEQLDSLHALVIRLPAPKVGFSARLFGGGRKKEQ